jgi:Transmembrane secretion effector
MTSGSPPGGYREVLAHRPFRAYWLSQAAGDAGYAVYAISIIWLGYRLSGSALVVGAILGVEFSVYAGSFLVGGVIDRIGRLDRVLRVGYPLQAAGAFALGTLLVIDRLTVPLLLVLVVLISVVWDFTWTANNTMTPYLVPRGQLLAANGLVSAATGGNQIAGYAIGGTLLLLVGPGPGQFLYAALNVVAALLVVPLVVDRGVPARSGPWIGELTDGWRFLARPENRSIRELARFGALEGALSLAPALLITLLSASAPSSPATTYGVWFTAYAVGGVAGSLALGAYAPRARLGALLFGAVAAEGALILAALAAAPRLLPGAGAWFGVGLTDVALWTILLAYVQAVTPGPLLARTITNSYLFRGSARAAGALALGYVAGFLSIGSLGLATGGLFVAVAAVGFAAFPALRRLRY